ncbi:flagellar FlbD family protein [Clostridium cellulovorans]|uniref:Flagellar FlbD family protein n=1 Tax=Clostridium cellulovorans (strain ATCC 35296 / DSM 3052 / OCM 3 / 743B) TaxID=573061 RepID=D9SKH1_CLOC7|nr:flagellar FlbD family protein [Clostridium cellulovorans]ADL51467.1 flagellar FlbD family protein [Clostridium cellulovorans 743B]
MIKVTTLSDTLMVLNGELIEKIESVPETVITLVNGKKYLVKESVDEVLEKVYEYKRRILI